MILKRPLAIFDIEATGLEITRDAIVSLSIIKLHPDGHMENFDYMFNPGFEMCQEVIEIHHITNEMVKDCPPFKSKAAEIAEILTGCDWCGYNIHGFDAQMIWEELRRAGIIFDLKGVGQIDPAAIFKIREKRDLEAALMFYCKRKLEGAHGARADAEATLDVLYGQVSRYPDLVDADVPALAKASLHDGEERVDLAGLIVRGADGIARYTHRKVRGVAVKDDPGYLEWMLKTDFPIQSKTVFRKLLAEILKHPFHPEDEDEL